MALSSIELLRENSDEYKFIMQQDESICEAYTHAYLILCSCNNIVNMFLLCKSCATEACAEKVVISNMKAMKYENNEINICTKLTQHSHFDCPTTEELVMLC